MKTKLILALLFITTLFYGQTQQTGEIVISKSNLISVLEKFKTQNKPVASEQENNNSLLIVNKAVYNDSLIKKVRFLENELAAIRSKMDAVANQTLVRDSVVTSSVKIIVIKDTVYEAVAATTQKKLAVDGRNKNYEQQLNALNSKYEALLRNQEKLMATSKANAIVLPTPVAIVANEKKSTAEKIEQVVAINSIDDLNLVADSTVIATTNVEVKQAAEFVSVQKILKEKYEKVQVQVFFDNDATTIQQGDAIRLKQFAKNLNPNVSLLLFLEGYSSKKGNAAYNNKLSLARNEAVKQFLIKNGVSSKSILSQHHGVDNSSSSEAMSRRVDVSFIVKE
jgi:outer membrane protein OmpA-like peptidoglycan-associated protein